MHTRVISSEGVEAPIQPDPGTERHTDLCFEDNPRDLNDKKMLVSYEVCRFLPLLFMRVLVIKRSDTRLWEILAEHFPFVASITCLRERAILHKPNGQQHNLIYRTCQSIPKAGVSEAA